MKTKNIPFVDLYAQYKNLKDQIDNSISECIINSDFIRSKSVSIFETEFAKLPQTTQDEINLLIEKKGYTSD